MCTGKFQEYTEKFQESTGANRSNKQQYMESVIHICNVTIKTFIEVNIFTKKS